VGRVAVVEKRRGRRRKSTTPVGGCGECVEEIRKSLQVHSNSDTRDVVD